MTPEGKVKYAIKRLLQKYGCWYYMPVPAGYGAPSLDFLCATPSGRAFGVEAKRPGGKPTARQLSTMESMESKGVRCFVIDGPMGLGELERFLMSYSHEQPL